MLPIFETGRGAAREAARRTSPNRRHSSLAVARRAGGRWKVIRGGGHMSLATRAVTVMLPVEDVDRAKKFYVENLGLDCTGTNGEGSAMFDLGGGAGLMLLPRPGATRSQATAMSWAVDDVGSE